jgi:[CysO sulfur-carrier protein]-thiocarboxylate-dependent cysteine synthase
VKTRSDDFAGLVGNTPVVRCRNADLPSTARLWIKMEGFNPTGSVKDRACKFLLRDALQRGTLQPGMTILDASSGNMACSIAYFGRVLDYKVRVVCGSKLTADKANFIRFFGAELTRHGHITLEANRFCREEISASAPDKYCFLDQLHNWANPKAAYETMGPEIFNDFPDVAAVVGSLGSGGTMYGTAKYLKDRAAPALVITTEASTGTKLPGTGGFDDGDYITPFIGKGLSEGLFAHRQKISYADAVKRTGELAYQGFFVGLQTGGVVQAAIHAARALDISGDIVAISGDSGWKNMDVLTREFVVG